jgi:hypothetical protein
LKIWKRLRSVREQPGESAAAVITRALIGLHRSDLATVAELVTDLRDATTKLARHDRREAERLDVRLQGLDAITTMTVDRWRVLELVEQAIAILEAPGGDAAERLEPIRLELVKHFAAGDAE